MTSDAKGEKGAMKRVLIIAFEFPPLASGGVMRCTKYVKYLRDCGWEPIVLTVDESAHGASMVDRRLLGELPGDIEIHRTPYTDFDALFNREVQSSTLLRIYLSMDAGFPGIFGFAKPDKNITWYPAALKKAKEILSKETVGLVYTDSPPNSSALLGYQLKALFGIPWIADFRDPWSLDELAYENLGPGYHQRARDLDRTLEKIILEKCDQLIVVSEKLKKNYVEQLGLPAGQISVIRDGYDEDDFRHVTPRRDTDGEFFKIKYMGSFYGSYNPSVFLQALYKIITEHNIADIRLHIIGHGSKWLRQHMGELNLHRLEPFIKTEEHMDMKQCLARMLDSDLLLAISPTDIDYNVPQKIYTYMKIGVPIFAVMPENGEAASVIKASGAGYVVDSKSIDQVGKKLHELYLAWKTDALDHKPDIDFIAGFDKRKLTGQLSNLFNCICGQKSTAVDEMNHEGQTLYRQSKFREALNTFQRALEINPSSTETLNNLGVVYFQLNRYDSALACLIKALEIKPMDRDALLNTYQLYRALDLKNDAKDILEKIREWFGDNELAGIEETL